MMHKKYRKYSSMKQKLGIAAAIMEKPDILILMSLQMHWMRRVKNSFGIL